jgi:hypothetical protein
MVYTWNRFWKFDRRDFAVRILGGIQLDSGGRAEGPNGMKING